MNRTLYSLRYLAACCEVVHLLRQGKGSHEVWKRDSDNRFTTIPNHGKQELKRKTLKAILEDLQISPEEFLKLK